MTRRDVIELLFSRGYSVNKLENMKDKKLIQLYNEVFKENLKKFDKY